MTKKEQTNLDRRGFIGTLSTGAAAIGMSMLASPLQASAKQTSSYTDAGDPDAWFNQLKGKHRVVFDADWPEACSLLPGPGYI